MRRHGGAEDAPPLELPELEPPRARGHRLVGAMLLGLALLMLGGTLYLGVDMVEQTSDIGRKVQLTEGIVDGNVRTLSQVQRELLRLDVLLAEDSATPEQVELQEALVSQRSQEGSLSYQRQTLGSTALVEESRRLAERWRSRSLPVVRRAFARPADEAAQRRARRELEVLERGYNQLVSDGEINRKTQAGDANRATRQMLARAHRLVRNLVAVFAGVVLLLFLGSVVYLRLHRQQERVGAELYDLNRELHRYAHVVRSTDNMVVITDAAGRVDWVNQAFVRTFGYTLLDLAGRRPGELLQGPDTDPDTVRRMSEALSAGDGFTDEVLNYGRDGRALWVSLDVSPVHDDHGTLTGFVAVETDVTERRQAETLLRAAKEDAEAAAREKSTFLASMSHEIRTPLNAVLGLTDLLLLTDLDASQREYVRTAHSSGRLLLALVNDILDFSALEAGRVETEQRAFSLETLLRDAVGMFRADAQRRNVGLHLEVDPDLPALVRGDETRLRQVLVNLLGNAVKFTERGEVELAVRVRSRHGSSVRLAFAVSDTGIGISSALVARLFQPFSQVDASTTRRYGGTGLGLAICRLLVERMGGAIDVVSAEGNGSIFHFEVTLPVASPDELEAPLGLAPGTSGLDVPPLRVLLAEDDRVNQTVAVHMLRRLGIQPQVVDNGRAAVDAVLGQEFDLVLMDVHMPTMDGVDATALIRASLPAGRVPRIAAVTANALEGDRDRLLASGMDDYLSKPVQLDALAAVLRRTSPGTPPRDDARRSDPGPPPVDREGLARATGISDPATIRGLLLDLAHEAERVASLAGGSDQDAATAEAAARALVLSASACHALPLRDAADALRAALGSSTDPGPGAAERARATSTLRSRLRELRTWATNGTGSVAHAGQAP